MVDGTVNLTERLQIGIHEIIAKDIMHYWSIACGKLVRPSIPERRY